MTTEEAARFAAMDRLYKLALDNQFKANERADAWEKIAGEWKNQCTAERKLRSEIEKSLRSIEALLKTQK